MPTNTNHLPAWHTGCSVYVHRQTDGHYYPIYIKMKGDGIMMNDNGRSLTVGATALITGLCIGVGTGVLFAPQSGARTRRRLRNFAEDIVEDTAEALDKVIERGRRLMPV